MVNRTPSRGGMPRWRRAPFAFARKYLSQLLLDVADAMADGSYWAPPPNDRDFEHPNQSAGFSESY